MQPKKYECPKCHRTYSVTQLITLGELGYNDVQNQQIWFCDNKGGRVICPECDLKRNETVDLELITHIVD